MEGQEKKTIGVVVGFGIFIGGTVWSIINWAIDRRKKRIKKEAKCLMDRNARPGYYWMEGFIDSDNPVEYNNQNFARISAVTQECLKIEPMQPNALMFSRCEKTTIEQVNVSQTITMNDIDITTFLNYFPLTTIYQSEGNLIQGLPINQGTYRISGWYDGNNLIRESGVSTIKSELNSQTYTTESFSVTPWAMMIVGGVVCLSKFDWPFDQKSWSY